MFRVELTVMCCPCSAKVLLWDDLRGKLSSEIENSSLLLPQSVLYASAVSPICKVFLPGKICGLKSYPQQSLSLKGTWRLAAEIESLFLSFAQSKTQFLFLARCQNGLWWISSNNGVQTKTDMFSSWSVETHHALWIVGQTCITARKHTYSSAINVVVLAG